MPGRRLAILVALAGLLSAAFVLAPPQLRATGSGDRYPDEQALGTSVRGTFVEYWSSGDREFTPALAGVVDYWFRFHMLKAAIAALLVIVFAALGIQLWKSFVRARGFGAGSGLALGASGVTVTLLGLFSVVLVVANIQGAAAPFASLLPMLTADPADGTVTATLDQVRQGLGAPHTDTSPALQVMIDDFAWYHVAMAVLAGAVALACTALSLTLWRAFARTEPSNTRTRRVLACLGTFKAVVAAGLIVVVIANTTTAADPAPALAALFDGSW
ncbi:hypothetical protein JK358_06805 [Nocardia sp. 2]|uniref:Tat (Twin-arginine translocation) pathway signal sequence n=1 Tax=Nocardia acididurans TaxID=2802282 RepID=A0ABS1M0S0_9NOCA|nr:hypothetical protein [Nocardia acididurans]MBL1074101.1 hypothetical protein [Nocardia acididurans]